MVLNLEQNAATNGFLGATSWMNTSTYTSGNMQMILLYFRSKKDVRAFYTSKAHKIGSSWSTRTREEGRASDIGLYQENYVSGKGEWDNFGKECVPCMFGEFLRSRMGERREGMLTTTQMIQCFWLRTRMAIRGGRRFLRRRLKGLDL